MSKKMPLEEETKKLTYTVIYMSMFVIVLFSVASLV